MSPPRYNCANIKDLKSLIRTLKEGVKGVTSLVGNAVGGVTNTVRTFLVQADSPIF